MNTSHTPSFAQILECVRTNTLVGNTSLITQALQEDAQNAAALFQLALACAQHERLDDAYLIFQCLESANPTDPTIPYNLGLVCSLRGEHAAALAAYERTLSLAPDDLDALVNKGATSNDLKDYAGALNTLERATQMNPAIKEAWLNLGIAQNHLQSYEQSIHAYDQALALDPQYFEAWVNRSVPLNALKRYQEACTSCERAIALRPHDAQGWLNHGIALNGLQLHQEALHAYDKALTLRQDYAEAHANKGATLQELGRLEEAITQYQKVLTLNPKMYWVYGSLLYTQSKICSWDHFDAELQNLSSMIMNGYQAFQPFPLLALTDDPSLHQVCAKSYADTNYPLQSSLGAIEQRTANSKVTIAYFSADFHHHATSHLMAELFELHDKSRFRVIGFSFGPESKDAVRARLCNAFDEFVDVQKRSDRDIAQLARQMGVDIAIDLKGYTQDSRPGIFAYRAAPIQVSYLGYPGTLGAPYMDYVIADSTIIPPVSQAHYCEKIVRLPNTYQVNDRLREIASTTRSRRDLGLPQEGFVFACFNNNYKILPATFDSWMRILKASPGSVLWLFEDNPLAAKNLKIAAEQRGVQSNRLIFANREALPLHLARHAYADLFLDTAPYNAHTTASDALWAGLPVLTLMGQSFASRVAASLLNAIGLPELITTTPAQYEAKAIALAQQTDTLAAIKAKLARQRLTAPLFDTPLFTQHLESAYQQMMERYYAGLEPEDLTIV